MIGTFLRLQPLGAATFIFCLFISPIQSFWMLVGGTGLGIALIGQYLAPNKVECPPMIWVALLGLVLSHLLAIPGSVWWGTGNWELTASAVLWMVPAVGLFWVADERVLPWLLVLALVHAAAVLFDSFTNWYEIPGVIVNTGAPTGLTFNANVAAGFLVLVTSICVWNGYSKWFFPPMLLGVLFTQSRWAVLVILCLTLFAFFAGRLEWRWLIYGALTLGVGILIMGIFSPYGYQVAGYNSITGGVLSDLLVDLNERLEIPAWPNLLPYGVVEHRGLHNVPLRMAREAGSIAAVIWIGVSIWGLTKERFSVWWWLLLTVLFLSLLDHYTFRPHLGGMWWLALGGMVNRNAHKSALDGRYGPVCNE